MECIIGVVIGLLFLLAYRMGIQDGLSIKETKKLTNVKLPKIPNKEEREMRKEAKKELDKTNNLLKKIDNFKG
jgi:hypothetical protein